MQSPNASSSRVTVPVVPCTAEVPQVAVPEKSNLGIDVAQLGSKGKEQMGAGCMLMGQSGTDTSVEKKKG